MDLYECTLFDVLKNQSESSNQLHMKERVQILLKVLDALIYIQENEMAHLDVKPSNVLLNKNSDGRFGEIVVLSDFGLSSNFDKLTGNGGTPAFGSPEQFIGKPSRKSDNYSFGKLGVITLFPWQTAWNLLAQPLKKGEISKVEKSKSLRILHTMISKLLHVSQYILNGFVMSNHSSKSCAIFIGPLRSCF